MLWQQAVIDPVWHSSSIALPPLEMRWRCRHRRIPCGSRGEMHGCCALQLDAPRCTVWWSTVATTACSPPPPLPLHLTKARAATCDVVLGPLVCCGKGPLALDVLELQLRWQLVEHDHHRSQRMWIDELVTERRLRSGTLVHRPCPLYMSWSNRISSWKFGSTRCTTASISLHQHTRDFQPHLDALLCPGWSK
jgi:hypothetical protein